jgi:hypothetical protein
MKHNKPIEISGETGIYTDGTHLIGITLEDLHQFTKSIGFKREWFQDKGKYPHYDITTNNALKRVLKAGAALVSKKELISICRICSPYIWNNGQ